ncbi:hypothetical protein Agub_g14449, partial [Astrephomene gubernaculifera]
MSHTNAAQPGAAAIDEAVVTEFIAQYYTRNPNAAPGIPFGTLKYACRAFRHVRFSDIKAWFRSRPQQYIVMGQLVVPFGLVEEMRSAASAAPTTAACTSTASQPHRTPQPQAPFPPQPQLLIPPHLRLPSAAANPAVQPAVPDAVLNALLAPQPGAPLDLYCSICKVRCTSEENMRSHLYGSRHRTAVARADAHQLEAAVLRSGGAAAGCSHCELCGRWFTRPDQLRAHVDSSRHRARVLWLLLLQRDPNLSSSSTSTSAPSSAPAPNPDGGPNVTVSALPQPLPPVPPGSTASHTFQITNHGPGAVKLRSVRFLTPPPPPPTPPPASFGMPPPPPIPPPMRLEDNHGASAQPLQQVVWLPEGATYQVRLILAPRALGLMRNVVIFDFGPAKAVARAVAASCCPPDMPPPPAPGEKPAGGTEVVRKSRKAALLDDVVRPEDVVPGVPPPGYKQSVAAAVPVRRLPPPEDLRRLVARGAWAEVRKRVPPLKEVKSLKQYAERLRVLLWLEELQHEVDVRMYDMKGVSLTGKRGCELLELQVPGLAENRPSVLKGDRLLLTPTGAGSGGKTWEGYVHRVEKEQVLLRFSDRFIQDGVWLAGRKFDVRFTVNRSAFNLMQNALLRAESPGLLPPHLVLPGTPVAPLPRPPPAPLPLQEPPRGDPRVGGSAGPLQWSPRVALKALNDEQKLAVREVVRGAHHPLPYLIFGPPGTGKTTTLVEAALQLLRTNPAHRLLAVAPSNSAADKLMEDISAIAQLNTGQIMRLVAFSRPLEDLPLDLQRKATSEGMKPWAAGRTVNWDEREKAFLVPPVGVLSAPGLRVVVATCAMAARLHHAGLPPGRFSHILVDEAGHAEEPLQLCALAGLAGRDTRVVLAGDPKQLGPIILSQPARLFGGLDV